VVFVRDDRKNAGDRHTSQKHRDKTPFTEEDEFSGLHIGRSDIDFGLETGDIFGEVFAESILEIIELEKALFGEDIEREQSERFCIDEHIKNLLGRVARRPVASRDSSSTDTIDSLDLFFVSQFFESFEDAERIKTSCASSGDDQGIFLFLGK